jgi:hypothetical protein
LSGLLAIPVFIPFIVFAFVLLFLPVFFAFTSLLPLLFPFAVSFLRLLLTFAVSFLPVLFLTFAASLAVFLDVLTFLYYHPALVWHL